MHPDRPSATALLIARSTLVLAHDPRYRRWVPAGAAELCADFLRTSSGLAGLLPTLVRRFWFRWLAFALERFSVRGIMLHYLMRKRCIETHVREALAAGAQQVVVMAAGFDTLALRLHREYPDVVFIEIDHPATQRVKQAALAQRPPAANVHFIAVDFTHDRLEQKLLAHPGYDRRRDSVFIAEGILMYLESHERDSLFDFIYANAAHGSRFLFSFMRRREDGDIHFHATAWTVKLWLRWRREMFKWGIAVEELEEFLARRGYALLALCTADSFRSEYLDGRASVPLADGECVCLARSLE